MEKLKKKKTKVINFLRHFHYRMFVLTSKKCAQTIPFPKIKAEYMFALKTVH